ncbi:MAG: hypothetical protein SXQ77_09910, partial [Halobacteria archaeon]|nr:hypothetical protein [Halobacteria archaeon]
MGRNETGDDKRLGVAWRCRKQAMNGDDIPVPVSVLILVVAVVVIAGIVAGVYVFGFGLTIGNGGEMPSAGGNSSPNASPVESSPTPSSENTTIESQESPSEPESPFTTRIVSIENCGQTCRDVTAELHNEMGTEATNVSVRTWIYAGNTTENDSLVWEGEKKVGDLEAGGTYRTTSRVELSFFEGVAIQDEGGWITVVTKVDSTQ